MQNILITICLSMISALAFATDEIYMSDKWGQHLCNEWNNNNILTNKLAGKKWIQKDGGKGYKIGQLVRSDCASKPSVEFKFVEKNGKAMCAYGGAPKHASTNKKHDYVFSATTSNWINLGRGSLGPKKALVLGKLKLKGPKVEALNNLNALKEFIRLQGVYSKNNKLCP